MAHILIRHLASALVLSALILAGCASAPEPVSAPATDASPPEATETAPYEFRVFQAVAEDDDALMGVQLEDVGLIFPPTVHELYNR